MRNGLILVAGVAALLGHAGAARAQAIPEAPQPQKKVTAKPPPAPDPPLADVPPSPPAKDENAFPEDVSRKAAAAPTPGKTSPADANPFPEDVSRQAAKEAEQENSPAPPKPTVPAGVSSSLSLTPPDEEPVLDPALSRKDTEVGGYYLKTQDYQGALLRYQEATRSDPTNVDAIFGLAEAQRSLGKNAEAAKEYQLYLDIVPNGPKAKQAMKALKTLSPTK